MGTLNEQAYELLRGSVSRFNDWKARQGDESIDLQGASLSGVRLAGVDLSQAILTDADLAGTDLSGANLKGTVLYRAQAAGAILARCKMADVYASEACLEGADLSQVRASAANFSRASLKGARFDHASLLEVNFEEADLSGASLVGALIVRTPFPVESEPTLDLKEAVIENGPRTPPVSSVDFRWISEDAMMFAIGQWTPKPELTDDEVPQFVRNLRKFNRGDVDVMKGFAKLIAGLLKNHHRIGTCDSIAMVPSSKTDTKDYPIRNLALEVARLSSARDGTGWLIRHKNTLPSGLLSFPSEAKHLDSVRVPHGDLVGGRTILLLDDFIDTGCSFRACRTLLLASGAKQVFCLALARRIPRED